MGDEVKPSGTCMGGSSSLGSRVTLVITFLIQASPLPVTGEVPVGHVHVPLNMPLPNYQPCHLCGCGLPPPATPRK